MITNSKNITVKKTQHRGNDIILLEFHNRRDWLRTIKKLPAIKFSRTLGFWYLPYNKYAFHEFVQLNLPHTIFSPHEVPEGTTGKSVSDREPTDISSVTSEESLVIPMTDKKDTNIQVPIKVNVTWNSDRFIIGIPYTTENIVKVKTLEAAWWHAGERKWICKSTVRNLESIHQNWEVWSQEQFKKLFAEVSKVENPCKVKLYYSPQYPEKVCIHVIGYGANINIVKQMRGRTYLKEQRLWLVDNQKEGVESLIQRYKEIGYTIENRLPTKIVNSPIQKSNTKRIERFLSNIDHNHYTQVHKMAYTMHSQGYGVRTILSYCGKLMQLVGHYKIDNLENLTVANVQEYVQLLGAKGVSFSLINQVHSGAKYYLNRISGVPHPDMDQLRRPKKRHKLPKFLSKKEIVRLFSSIDNMKHLAVVYILYGSGLRRSELLNIRLEEIYWDRNQILIANGKGSKDRMVNIGQEAKLLLETYFHEYKPQRFLFEGSKSGMPYTASSVSAIIKKAAKKAQISKNVTPHMLRHSFATHLMDQGVALPKIQKLLGHKDVKTTMIYTHVSNNSINEIISPLDFLKKVKRDTE